MESREVLFGISGWVALVALLAVTNGAAEIGYRIGFRRRQTANESLRTQVTTIQASLLGALALLLGFSFSMASTRFEMRRSLMVSEANAISTAYLRASVMPEPERTQLRRLFRDYAAARIAHVDAGSNVTAVRAAEADAERLQRSIWNEMPGITSHASAPIAALMLASANEVFDSYTLRLASMSNHVPDTILVLIFVVSGSSMALVGYGAGLSGKRSTVPTVMAAVLFSLMAMLVIDLDRPRQGWIRVSEAPIIEALDAIMADADDAPPASK